MKDISMEHEVEFQEESYMGIVLKFFHALGAAFNKLGRLQIAIALSEGGDLEGARESLRERASGR